MAANTQSQELPILLLLMKNFATIVSLNTPKYYNIDGSDGGGGGQKSFRQKVVYVSNHLLINVAALSVNYESFYRRKIEN